MAPLGYWMVIHLWLATNRTALVARVEEGSG